MNKNKILETIEALPIDVELDDLFEKLILIEKVEAGIKQANENKLVSHEEVKNRINTWRK